MYYPPNWQLGGIGSKLIAPCKHGPVELYDLVNDPDERVNLLAEREREAVKDLKTCSCIDWPSNRVAH